MEKIPNKTKEIKELRKIKKIVSIVRKVQCVEGYNEKCKTCYNEDCEYMLTKLECDRCGNIMKDKQYNVVKHDFYWKTNKWYCMKCIYVTLPEQEKSLMVAKYLSESFSLLGNIIEKNIII